MGGTVGVAVEEVVLGSVAGRDAATVGSGPSTPGPGSAQADSAASAATTTTNRCIGPTVASSRADQERPVAELAVTAIGADRPGVIAVISEVLRQRGGNILDSSMTILG